PLCSSLSPISLLSHATPTSEFYTLSLHDALPIYGALVPRNFASAEDPWHPALSAGIQQDHAARRSQSPSEDVLPHRVPHLCPFRSEEHTSELQSRENLVCRLLLEKKKKKMSRIRN